MADVTGLLATSHAVDPDVSTARVDAPQRSSSATIGSGDVPATAISPVALRMSTGGSKCSAGVVLPLCVAYSCALLCNECVQRRVYRVSAIVLKVHNAVIAAMAAVSSARGTQMQHGNM
eukprot:2838-Heterococcus_DN1.PRE.1